MLEWMIAAVAACGAIAGFTALLLVLRFMMQVRGDSAALAQLERVMPRARVHRCREVTTRRQKALRLAR
jgi:hypothetical protein